MDEIPFGRYRLLSVIGQGGMGTVYKAHDTVIDRDVAIKVLPSQLGTEPGYRQRFRREANTAARLAEPHIIPIHDTGEIDGQLYLVMPIVDGVDVHGLLRRDGAMEPERAVRVIEQLAAALDAAHAAGLVHRDIKPTNALVTGDDFVYLIDFGIAHETAATKLTRTGTILGTWAYMAPERFTTGTSEPSADIYALTCVLYECLTGTQPYPGDSLEQQFTGHYSLDPPKPSTQNRTVPTQFDAVIARGMAKDPQQRYQNARALAAAARQALPTTPSGNAYTTHLDTQATALTGPAQPTAATAPITKAPAAQRQPRAQPAPRAVPAPWWRRHTSGLIAAGVAIILAVIGVTAYALRPRSPAPAPPAPTAQSAKPLRPTALDGLLLSSNQLDTAMGAKGMTAVGTITTLPDGSGQVPDKACVPLEGAGQATVYAGSGWTAVSGQRVADQTHAHLLEQVVVSFPSAQAARAFFTSSAQRWPACANRQHDETTTSGQIQAHTVGPVSNTNGTLSATVTGVVTKSGGNAVCERALTVANNVAIDIDACSANPSGAAVNIADQIAAKVPTN